MKGLHFFETLQTTHPTTERQVAKSSVLVSTSIYALFSHKLDCSPLAISSEILTGVYEPPLTMAVCDVPFATCLDDGHEVRSFNLANSRGVGLLYHPPYCRPVERGGALRAAQ